MSAGLSWEMLLSPERARSGERRDSGTSAPRVSAYKEERTAFEQDYDRIVFSQPFRRLARKTQVHPMASNDHVHNRLTHSIEVASVGRSFARRVARLAHDRSDLPAGKEADLAWILQSACLVHDLGNPPFGHAGEYVIRAWAEENRTLLFSEERLASDPALAGCQQDWLNFEGNAQGFRVASRSDNAKAGYLRLTYATLGAAIKYPWAASDPKTALKQKHNYYSTEADLFQKMAATLGLIREDGSACRHPLSFLTEAADDICYRIIDLEDAVEMRICEHDVVFSLFEKICPGVETTGMPLSQLRGQAIRSLMDQCWRVYESNFQEIMQGGRDADLKSSLDDQCKALLAEVDRLYESIFSHRRKVSTELGAYHVLSRILEALVRTVHVICDQRERCRNHFLTKRTIDLTWGMKYVEQNLQRPYSWWLSQVMDYVGGMTDDYAWRLSREIGGLSVGLGD